MNRTTNIQQREKGSDETDQRDHQAHRVSGKTGEKDLVNEWDLDLDIDRPSAALPPRRRQSYPKLIHKLVLSMPPGTEPKAVLEAVRNFTREEFGLQHRYAMVLHTDEPHPHVHVLVKAVSEQGVRLNIRKETLRRWRAEYARHLRDLGVPANATERMARGEASRSVSNGEYWTAARGIPLSSTEPAAQSQTYRKGPAQISKSDWRLAVLSSEAGAPSARWLCGLVKGN
jgi:hypothetical protein